MADAATKLLVEGLPPSAQAYDAPFIELGMDMLDWVTMGSLSNWCRCGEISPYMLYATLGTASLDCSPYRKTWEKSFQHVIVPVLNLLISEAREASPRREARIHAPPVGMNIERSHGNIYWAGHSRL